MFETMAHAGIAWNGLGVQLDHNKSIDEWMEAAQIKWSLVKRPIRTEGPGGTARVIPGKFSLQRDYDGRHFSIVGDNWNPVQPRETVEMFREYTETGGAKMEVLGSFDHGRTIWALASVNHEFGLQNDKTDTTKGYVLFTSPNEVGRATTIKTVSLRMRCANCLPLLSRRGGEVNYRQSHHLEFDFDTAKERIEEAHEELRQFEVEANLLSGFTMSPKDSVHFLSQFFVDRPEDVGVEDWKSLLMDDPNVRSNELEQVLESWQEAPGHDTKTAWGCLQAITHWADHRAGYSESSRLKKALHGRTARIKEAARSRLLELVQ